MYYSKSGSIRVTVPKNYAGNAFYTDEMSEQSAPKNVPDKTEFLFPDSEKVEAVEEKNDKNNNILASLVSDISVEDLLLVGLIFVIYQSDPKDPTLIILLILLLVK